MACAGLTIWGGLVNAGLKAGETMALVGAGGGLGRKSFLEVALSQIALGRVSQEISQKVETAFQIYLHLTDISNFNI